MISSRLPSLAAHLLSNRYKETRTEYYRQLERSHRTRNPVEFIQYALQGFVDALNAQMGTIKECQWRAAWENHVHRLFEDQSSPSDTRKLHLALDLSEVGRPVTPGALPLLTPRLAAAYAGTTAKTLTRDINTNEQMGLIRGTSKRIVVNTGIVRAFGPISGSIDSLDG